MLWTMLRWNAGNTLPLAAFCLLSLLGAVNSGLTANGNDNERSADTRVCSGCSISTAQLSVSAPHPR
jgi:hypothetical protein